MGANIIIPKSGGGASIWERLLGDKTFKLKAKDIDGITELRDYVFANKNITQAELPSTLQTIGNYAFYGCSLMTDITIPNSVTHISSEVFTQCNNLDTIYFVGTSTEWNNILKDYNWDGGRQINIVYI